MARKMTRDNISGAALHTLAQKWYAVVPAGFVLAPENRLLPHENTYTLFHFATDKVTGDMAFMVTALDADALEDFKKHYPTAKLRQHFKNMQKRGDWQMNSFPTLDDGVSDFETVFLRGVGMMERIATDQSKRGASAGAADLRLGQDREQKRLAHAVAVDMYKQGENK